MTLCLFLKKYYIYRFWLMTIFDNIQYNNMQTRDILYCIYVDFIYFRALDLMCYCSHKEDNKKNKCN